MSTPPSLRNLVFGALALAAAWTPAAIVAAPRTAHVVTAEKPCAEPTHVAVHPVPNATSLQ